MSEDFDDIADGPISIDRAKHHCARLAVDCGWRAMEVEMHIDAQAKIITDQLCEHNEREHQCFYCHTKQRDQMIAVLLDEVRAWRDADARHDLTRNVMGDGHNDRVLQAMAATDAILAQHNKRL